LDINFLQTSAFFFEIIPMNDSSKPQHDNQPELNDDQLVDSLILKQRPFNIVGMGGSAGSFNAIREFLMEIPADSGIAFVLVQHLDPSQPSILAELLQRTTSLSVLRVEDGMEVKPNHLYVIPENKEMAIRNGRLMLAQPEKPRGRRMVIDSFLESLAADWGEKAICAIFSGMGSDGETGARFIKDALGLVMVQAPDSAQFQGMPQSVIDSDNPDIIESPAAMAQKLLSYVASTFQWTDNKEDLNRKEATMLQKIFALLRNRTGHDFSLYKKNTLIRRVERRIHLHQLLSQEEYIQYLQHNPKEVDALFKELLIGVTKFFRDYPAFHNLASKALPDLIKRKQKNEVLRIWISGCSTGEEAYTIAILVRECLEDHKLHNFLKVQIFATDLDAESIHKARLGAYHTNIANDISADQLERWFTLKDNLYHVNAELREMIVFAEHNLIRDASFTNLDLLCCRNLLIYFTAELQKKLLPVFHYVLKPGGVLFLGPSESISGYDDLFATIDSKWKIFKRRENASSTTRFIEFPAQKISALSMGLPKPTEKQSESNWDRSQVLPNKIKKILLDKHTPPSVVVNTKGEVVYIHGRTGKYLEPAPGQLNVSIYDMAREGLGLELRGAILRAVTQGETVVTERIRVKTNGHYQLVKLAAEPITDEELSGLLLITFQDMPTAPKVAKGKAKSSVASQPEAVQQLEHELSQTRQHLQQTVEQMQTTVEELKSANEELQSTNEELQSTNEESNTTKEEMQALNEELLTVNVELRSKTDELTQLNNDIANLLNSSEVATIFLGNHLQIKRFTPSINQILNLVQTDLGRPITHFNTNLKYEHLERDIKEVQAKLIPKEVEVESNNDKWYQLRIIPYRTLDNFIAGVVLTFVDISHFKRLQSQLQEALTFSESILNSTRDPIVVVDNQLRILSINLAFQNTFQVDKAHTLGRTLFSLGNGQWDISSLRQLLETVIAQHEEFNDFLVEHQFPNVGFRRMKLHARQLVTSEPGKEPSTHGAQSQPWVLLTFEDITER
jgi:two-component system, chemotaxis family, CheB/CheR fusion protein